MSESVAPAVVLETESDTDSDTETPYQEASAGTVEVTEEDESDEEEDQNKEMSEEEKTQEEEEIWKKRERDFFSFMTLGKEMLDDRPLVGRELLREVEFHKKMRSQALEQVKKLRNSPYMKKLMRFQLRDPTLADLDESKLDIQSAFMPHPYPL